MAKESDPAAVPDREARGAGRDEPRTNPADATSEAAATESAEALKDRWLRAEADLHNFRRRARRDVDETRRAAEDAALLEVVSFVDDLERALAAAEAAGAPPSWSEGVRLVASRMMEYLARYGVEAMDPVGLPFDPIVHEAVLEMAAPEGVEPGHVMNVVRKGYRRDGLALRPARVVVARSEPGSA